MEHRTGCGAGAPRGYRPASAGYTWA